MVVLRLFEMALGAIFLFLIITQVLVPAVKGSPLFPIFRRRAELQQELVRVNEEEQNAKLEADLKRRQADLAKHTKGGK